MRRSRLAVVTVLLALVVLGAGLTVVASGSGGSKPAVRRAAYSVTASTRALQIPLARLRQELVRGASKALPRAFPLPGAAVPLPRDLTPGPSACPVAGGVCSLTPCVEYVQGASTLVATPASVAATSAEGTSITATPVASAIVATSGDAVVTRILPRIIIPRPVGSSCHRPAKTVRVSAQALQITRP
jgi:hypothetical protein